MHPISYPLRIAILVLALAATTIQIEAMDHLATGRSYDPEISVEKRYPDTKGGYEIWLVHRKSKTEAPLYRTGRSAVLHFSTDMKWVVINDAEGSGTTTCKVFKRKGNKGSLDYRLFKDITLPAWEFFESQTGREAEGLHHRYVRARCWLEDPGAVVISLIGHGDPGHFKVRYWTCVYLVDEDRFTVDLEATNRERVIK